MIYSPLFAQRAANARPVRAGVIGTGHYATAILAQARSIAGLDVPIVADLNVAAARTALRHAGWADDDIDVCENAAATRAAFERGRRVIVTDASLMMDLPIDIVVEATGVAGAGARHGQEAIRHGKHVAMVTKETDVAVGPILKRMADRAGLVYTAVDGDQHGLLIGLVGWARELGLEILCGGKALEFDAVVDPQKRELHCEQERRTLPPEIAELFAPVPRGDVSSRLEARRREFKGMCRLHGYDVTEMTLAANGTGLVPDVPELHCPAVHVSEIVDVLCPRASGGVLSGAGRVEAVSCLKLPHEAGLAGGVFVVVNCATAYAREILRVKGHVTNRTGDAFLITRAHHLCGVETPLSLLAAVRLGVPTGAIDYRPRFDVVAEAVEPFAAGEVVPTDKSLRLRALMRPAQAMQPGAPIPLHVASGCRLRRPVAAGEVIMIDMVEPAEDTLLWRLRREQDAMFFPS